MDAIDVGLVALGLFYVFAGVVATRAALVSWLLDRALAAIGGNKPDRREAAQAAWLLVAANLVLAGGAALAMRSTAALWLFAASLAGQVIYLTLATRYFDAEDPADAAGRRQTRNAAFVYAIATGLVAWAAYAGRLQPWRTIDPLLLWLACAAVATHGGYTLWRALQPIAAGDMPPVATESLAAATPPPSEIRRVAVMSNYYCFPTWAMEPGQDGDMPPEDLGLSPGLCRDLLDWAEAYLDSMDEADPSAFRWSDERLRRHEGEGRALAARIAAERPDLEVHVFTTGLGIVPLSEAPPG